MSLSSMPYWQHNYLKFWYIPTGLHDVTHQRRGFFFSLITIYEAGILYSYVAHL
jgi:hypothetical protein